MPSIDACPPSMSFSPSSISSVVVLPAPFGPRMPKISPVSMRRETPSTAREGIVFVIGKWVGFRKILDFDNWHVRLVLDFCYETQLVSQGNELYINGCYSAYHSFNWWRRGELNSRPSARRSTCLASSIKLTLLDPTRRVI